MNSLTRCFWRKLEIISLKKLSGKGQLNKQFQPACAVFFLLGNPIVDLFLACLRGIFLGRDLDVDVLKKPN